jgi:urease accessory protein
VQSSTSVGVGVDAHGRTRLIDVHCEVPQLVRVTEASHHDEGQLQLHLVGGAAGPLGGDQWRLRLDLASHSSVRLRSVAASLAQPDPQGRPSVAHITAQLGRGAHLDAWPEPLVSVLGSHHTLDVCIDVAAEASLRWVDEVVLGRHDEPSGTVILRQRVVYDGAVVSVSHLTLGAEATKASFGAHGPYRVVVSAVGRFEGPSAVVVESGVRAVRCNLGGGWASWTAVAHQHAHLHEALAVLGLER